MPRLLDLSVVRNNSLAEIDAAQRRYVRLHDELPRVDDRRWLASATLTEMHGAWEQFAERRLVASLNHQPSHFLQDNSVLGVSKIPSGLADYLVRGGRKYFDFRSCSDLIDRADSLVSVQANPFRQISPSFRNHLDVAVALRNFILHGSDAAWDSMKKQLRMHFTIRAAPKPGEFLDSIDRRAASPMRGERRIIVFSHVFTEVIRNT